MVTWTSIPKSASSLSIITIAMPNCECRLCRCCFPFAWMYTITLAICCWFRGVAHIYASAGIPANTPHLWLVAEVTLHQLVMFDMCLNHSSYPSLSATHTQYVDETLLSTSASAFSYNFTLSPLQFSALYAKGLCIYVRKCFVRLHRVGPYIEVITCSFNLYIITIILLPQLKTRSICE